VARVLSKDAACFKVFAGGGKGATTTSSTDGTTGLLKTETILWGGREESGLLPGKKT